MCYKKERILGEDVKKFEFGLKLDVHQWVRLRVVIPNMCSAKHFWERSSGPFSVHILSHLPPTTRQRAQVGRKQRQLLRSGGAMDRRAAQWGRVVHGTTPSGAAFLYFLKKDGPQSFYVIRNGKGHQEGNLIHRYYWVFKLQNSKRFSTSIA